jgi:glycosyltransferase involved in cell wall biosynthesis
LEAAALGIPVIASDAEPYREFVVHGVTGFLVRRDHEWLTYLQQLAGDEGLRESMGHKAREHARAFTIENNWHLWEQAYGRLL